MPSTPAVVSFPKPPAQSHLSEATGPVPQGGVVGVVGGKTGHAQAPAELVQRDGDVEVLAGVNAQGHNTSVPCRV
ncbi:hypothetical protein GCM10022267_90810 [Lentzea roselyniae]|uniref:Uncharacterized protein n=1 Tax=Lentzea roselyniae TaxID=531940 RepID=A0ABP7CGC8_9PSEU